MKTQISALWTAGGLFGLMALVQLARLVIRPDVMVAGHHIPLWPSVLAFLILAGMSTWTLRLAAKSKARLPHT